MNFEELLALGEDELDQAADPVEPGADGLLERNLSALAHRSPGEAQRIREAKSRVDVEFVESEEGLSAMLGGIAMGSKRRPVTEAARFAETMDPEETAIVAVLGFGLGYHCQKLTERVGGWGVVVCYEPDVGLLRSVLSRVDCTVLFATGRFMLVCDPDDSVRCNQAFKGNEALVGMGVHLMAHPPSVNRLGATADRFSRCFTGALRAARTHVVTTLANARTTLRNALMNTDHYVRSAGIASLEGCCAGKPAIVVSAGPSLERNIELLREEGVRDRFVIVAVQTVLKPLLERGIRPHFVAALDYHEVSGRFYEGLTEEDVRGVRLIAEAKANPVILDAFPGEVLCPRDEQLDRLLGAGLRRERGRVPMGATVAHLCYSFARYLGCDPVILIGQDLGFSDGQYYANGAAIHSVWGSELSAHRTLEMFEWERVARMRAHLHRREDIHGDPIYSDEQMCSYLAMFEELFRADAASGQRVIDASEGGVLKRYTQTMTLREAMDQSDAGAHGLPDGEWTKADAPLDPRVDERLAELAAQLERIVAISEESIGLLGRMLDAGEDRARVSELVERVHRGRDELMKMGDAFHLVESTNQVAVLNRMKRDRVIRLREPESTPLQKQRLQIERDIVNVEWTRDAARSVGAQIGVLRSVLRGQTPKVTSDRPDAQSAREAQSAGVHERERRDTVHALVLADPDVGGLGTGRDLGVRVIGSGDDGMNVLQATVTRLGRSAQIDAITLVTPEPDRVRDLLGTLACDRPVSVVRCAPRALREHARRVGAARMQSSTSWRGSLGFMSASDEVGVPAVLAPLMETMGIDGAVLVGGDWCMIDPALVDECVDRFRTLNTDKRVAFSQAPVGLGAMVVDRATVRSLHDSARVDGRRNPLSTLGALVSYLPTAPQADPIVRGVCVQIDPRLRDAGVRAVADTPARAEAIRGAFASMSDPIGSDALLCARELRETGRPRLPRTLVLETCTGRLMGGVAGQWKRGAGETPERRPISMGDAHKLMRELGQGREDACLVFDGVGDPLMHPGAMDLVALAKEDGIACVEMRTDLLRDSAGTDAIIESGLDILSVDVIADDASTYAQLAGTDAYERVCDRLQAIHDATSAGDGPWLAARMTRCAQTLRHIEGFYDKWLLLTGGAIIDPLPRGVDDPRVRPLDIPRWRREQMEREIMRVRCDGVVVDRDGRAVVAQGSAINAIEDGLERAFQRMRAAARASVMEAKQPAGEHAA